MNVTTRSVNSSVSESKTREKKEWRRQTDNAVVLIILEGNCGRRELEEELKRQQLKTIGAYISRWKNPRTCFCYRTLVKKWAGIVLPPSQHSKHTLELLIFLPITQPPTHRIFASLLYKDPAF